MQSKIVRLGPLRAVIRCPYAYIQVGTPDGNMTYFSNIGGGITSFPNGVKLILLKSTTAV